MLRKKSLVIRAFVFFSILALLTLAACQKKGEEVPLEEPPTVEEETSMPALPRDIEIPPEVAAKWKAVILKVADRETSEETEVTFSIGETAPLAKTGLTLSVEAFLPAFQMAGDVYTSTSAEPTNPAAKVKITDKSGSLLFDGWLFAMYPATHPFQHERYAVVLSGYVANQ